MALITALVYVLMFTCLEMDYLFYTMPNCRIEICKKVKFMVNANLHDEFQQRNLNLLLHHARFLLYGSIILRHRVDVLLVTFK